jgi:2-polyprenyl-6-methoxyphenol hydroxylase-like FAD-dependent oxidoreductase
MLARKGVDVTLLEAHTDFDRDFRGDTLHPSVLEIMDELGLADRLLTIPHTRLQQMAIDTPQGRVVFGDLRDLKTKFPFIAMMPQARFLEFVTGEAARYPNFRLIMGARVEGLLEEQGIVSGVIYRDKQGSHELRATLTVGADGRFSKIRKLAGIEPVKQSPPIDVIWVRLPRKDGDPQETTARTRDGRAMVLVNRYDYWQIGSVILKGSYQQLREAGLEAFRRSVAETLPEVADRVDYIQEWKQVSLLSVEASRVAKWHRPGLLLIGDAAHTMSPVGGFGINMAIQDAVEAANVLTQPLLLKSVTPKHLAEVQRRREFPTKFIQRYQAARQRRMLRQSADLSKPFKLPLSVILILKVRFIRNLPLRLTAFGVRRVHVQA